MRGDEGVESGNAIQFLGELGWAVEEWWKSEEERRGDKGYMVDEGEMGVNREDEGEKVGFTIQSFKVRKDEDDDNVGFDSISFK